MKRLTLLLLFCLLSAVSIQAQIITKANKDKIGQNIKDGINDAIDVIRQDANPTGEHELWDGYVAPRFGLGVSSLPGAGGRPELGAVCGVYFEAFVAKNIGLSLEINYSHQGGNNIFHAEETTVYDDQGNATGTEINAGHYNYDLNYINTLYLIHWYPWSYRPLSFYTGLQLSRLVSAKCHKKGSTTSNIKDDLFGGEFQIPIGASYEWKQWEFDVRYFISPRKLASSHRARRILGDARNMSIAFTVAYKVQIF